MGDFPERRRAREPAHLREYRNKYQEAKIVINSKTNFFSEFYLNKTTLHVLPKQLDSCSAGNFIISIKLFLLHGKPIVRETLLPLSLKSP